MVCSVFSGRMARAAGEQPPASDRSPPRPADDEASLFAELGQISRLLIIRTPRIGCSRGLPRPAAWLRSISASSPRRTPIAVR